MNTKRITTLLGIVLFGSTLLFAQNPYKSLGVEMETLTLSKGKYVEFFPNDSLVQIGSVILDTRNNTIVSFVVVDTAYYEATLEPELTIRFLQPDPYAAKYPNVSPYTYALNNPIRLIDPDGKAPQDPFLITVRTYIPYKSVGGFHGDNRHSSTKTNASYRTSHQVAVETNPNVSQSPLLSDDGGLTGVTKTTIGSRTRKAPDGAEGGFTASISRSDANGGDNAVITFSGSAKNPFIGDKPEMTIDYNFSIEIIPGQDGGAPTVNVTGSHDGFPAYEINIQDQNGNVYQVYHDEPEGKWEIVRLARPNDDTKIDQ